jgi:hypothetical protein
MRIEDLKDPDILSQKQEQINNSLNKFQKHFKNNLMKLISEEATNPKTGPPRFVTCFLDLASALDINLDDIYNGACTPIDKKSIKSRINTGESVKISEIIDLKSNS